MKAQRLRQQPTKLKNRLLTGLMPCHCTSAGACQNIMETGMYSAKASMAAFWNSGLCSVIRSMVPPSR